MDESIKSDNPAANNNKKSKEHFGPQLPYPPENDTARNEKDKTPKDKISNIIAGFALIISIIAVGFNYWQVTITKDTAKRQLRAYISMNIMDSWEGDFMTQPIKMGYKLVNHGQTPARITEIGGEINIFPFPLPKNFMPEYPLIQSKYQKSVVFSDNVNDPFIGYIPAKRVFTQDDIFNINSIKSNIRAYMFACIKYEDVFGKTRHTFYCLYMEPGTYRKVGKDIFFRWVINDEYNDFD